MVDSIQTIKKWYGTMVSIFARPTHWIPMPVMICWSDSERSSLREMRDREAAWRSSARMIQAERRNARPAVMMKERRTYQYQ